MCLIFELVLIDKKSDTVLDSKNRFPLTGWGKQFGYFVGFTSCDMESAEK